MNLASHLSKIPCPPIVQHELTPVTSFGATEVSISRQVLKTELGNRSRHFGQDPEFAALVTELMTLGCGAVETDDGLVVTPARLSAPERPWPVPD